MASAGRQVCVTAIWTAAELRRYGEALSDFEMEEARDISRECFVLARRLEELTQPILAFEGENVPQLTAAAVA